MKRVFDVFLISFAVLSLIVPMGCGGGGGGDDDGPVTLTSTVSGTASTSAGSLADAAVTAYYYDDVGELQELTAYNGPVITDGAGQYEFEFDVADLADIAGPVMLVFVPDASTSAPTLKTLVVDPTALLSDGATATSSANGLTTTTAEYLESYLENQPAGTTVDSTVLTNVITTVNSAFNLTWDDATDAEEFEATVLPNLGGDKALLDDFATYLADDLTDGTIDGQGAGGISLDPATYGSLSDVLPGGLSDFHVAEISTTDSSIGSNSSDSTALTVTVTDAIGQPVAGVSVNFLVSTGGTLDSESVDTDANGVALVNLTSDTPGNVTVTYTYVLPSGATVSGSEEIVVSDCSAVAGVTLSTDKTTIYDDNLDSAVITADLTAACSGSAVADNTDVTFAITGGEGTLFPVVAQSLGGQAVTDLSSYTTGIVTVQGGSGGYSDSVDVNVIDHPCDPSAISLVSDSGSIIADSGLATLTATVYPADAANCPGGVFDDTEISFVIASGTGVLSDTSAFTTSGEASVTLESDTVNTVTVEATVGSVLDSAVVNVVGDPCAAGNVTVTSDISSLTTAETAIITATVEPADSGSCPSGVADGTPISFSVNGSGSVSAAQQTTADGIASVTYAPQSAGDETVTASVNGQSDATTLTVIDQPTTTTVTVLVPEGTSFSGVQLTLDYDETVVNNGTTATGDITNGWTILPNDDGNLLGVGLFSFADVQASATDAVFQASFDVLSGVPEVADFTVTEVLFTDADGTPIGLTPADITLQISNN